MAPLSIELSVYPCHLDDMSSRRSGLMMGLRRRFSRVPRERQIKIQRTTVFCPPYFIDATIAAYTDQAMTKPSLSSESSTCKYSIASSTVADDIAGCSMCA